jgi:hypothetical protein
LKVTYPWGELVHQFPMARHALEYSHRIAFLQAGFAVAVLLAVATIACDLNHPPEERTAQAERIILTFSGDPTTSVAVTWRTRIALSNARAQIKPATASAKPEPEPLEAMATTHPPAVESGGVFHHSVVFMGLNPDSLYAYRVGNDDSWSDWFHFRTASREAKPFRFLFFGDEQNDIGSSCSHMVRRALEEVPDACFMLHAGDLTNAASSDSEWGEWFAMAGRFNASVPSLPAIGNHQYERVWYSPWRSLTEFWRAQFTLPLNGVPGLEESCYFVDYQGVRIVVLNSMQKLAEQAQWLDGILSANPCRWTVALFHHPVFSGFKERDNAELRRLWKPVLEKHSVDLVLQGHDHVYGRSNPAKNPEHLEPVYVVSVTGPKMYNAGDRSWAARFAQDTQMYQVISINEEVLRFEARTATSELYDAFEIHQRGRQKTFVVGPLGPERLRPNGGR